MKKVVLGGFMFLGGCVLYGIGALGAADTTVMAYQMQMPMYAGGVFILAGAALGLSGLLKKESLR